MGISLSEARKAGKLDQFMREHEEERGDASALDRTVSSMAGKSSEAPKALSRRNRGG